MAREIKFRVWDGFKMTFPAVIDPQYGTVYMTGRDYEDGRNFKSAQLMQFTGLLDKNGKEIYESDVLFCQSISEKFPGEPRWLVRVVFEDASFCLGSGGDPLEKNECLRDMEIIGSVFQNPELIKELDYNDQ